MSLDVYPQLRVTPDNDVAAQARRALAVKATGVFLYPHPGVGDEQFMETYEHTRAALSQDTDSPFVGVMAASNQTPRNLFGVVVEAVRRGALSAAPSAVFVPDAKESALFTKSFRKQYAEILKETPYFGGFEHTTSVASSEESALFNSGLIVDLVDVVVSRVDSLNPFEAASKAKLVKDNIGQKPLAAYGRLSTRNIDNVAPYVDKLLLGHGIETSVGSGEICFSALRSLILMAKTAS